MEWEQKWAPDMRATSSLKKVAVNHVFIGGSYWVLADSLPSGVSSWDAFNFPR